jgi:flagellar hook-length control protein FliK
VIPMVAAPAVPAAPSSAPASGAASSDAAAEAGASDAPESAFLTALRSALGKANEAVADGAALVTEVEGEVEGEEGDADGEGDEEAAEAAAADIAIDAATQLAMVGLVDAPIEATPVEIAPALASGVGTSDEPIDVASISPQVDLAAVATETAPEQDATSDLASGEESFEAIAEVATAEMADTDELVPVADGETMPNITPVVREQAPTPPDQPIAVEQVAPPAESNTAMKTEPWQQMVEVLRPIKQFSDGTHRLSIQLRPEDMGTINVELAVNKGTLSLHVVADTAATRDAISASLSQLRSEIEAGGVRTGSFGVGQQTAGDRQHAAASQRNARGVRSYAVAGIDAIDLTSASSAPTATASAMDGRLDLRI